jgi:hypothetical protein
MAESFDENEATKITWVLIISQYVGLYALGQLVTFLRACF